MAANLASPDDVAAWHDATVERFGGVDLLFTNGGGPPAGRVLDFGDAWFPNYAREGILDRVGELRKRADRPVEVMLMGVPAKPGALERAHKAGCRRVLHWIPSVGKSQVEAALEKWEAAITEFTGEA